MRVMRLLRLAEPFELFENFFQRSAKISHAFFLLLDHGGRGLGHEGFVAQLALGLGDFAL